MRAKRLRKSAIFGSCEPRGHQWVRDTSRIGRSPPKKNVRTPGARSFGRIATKAVAFEAHDLDVLYDTSYVVIGQELRKREPKDF